jgi:NADP-dependent 3-hydroxy acid dehydrogenase YdfG
VWAPEAMLEPSLDSPLARRVAVVTGASSGIGRAIALALAVRGATVCLVGRDRRRLASTARSMAGRSPQVLVQQVDLARADELDDLIRRLQAQLTGLDILVHSAGMFRAGSYLGATAQALDQLYQINVRAPYCLTRALLPLLRANRGQVVFINSSAGLRRAGQANGLYASTKHTLRALADSLRDEVNPDGVRVLSIYPGRVATPIQRDLFAREGKPYDPSLLLQPEDVAAMVIAALSLPCGAEVTDISMRPSCNSY